MNTAAWRCAWTICALAWPVGQIMAEVLPASASLENAASPPADVAESADQPTVLQASMGRPLGYTCARCGRRQWACTCQCPCPVGGGEWPQPMIGGADPGSGISQSPLDQQPGAGPLSPQAMNQTPGAANPYGLAGNYGAARGPEAIGTSMLGDFFVGNSFGSSNLTLSGGQGNYYQETARYGNGSRIAAPLSTHTFKLADTESPWPRTRVFFNTNYFDQVGGGANVTRELLGFERLVGDSGRWSFGLRLPIYEVNGGSQTLTNSSGGNTTVGTFGSSTGTQSSVGDLTVYFKYALLYDPTAGNVLSAGAAVVTPTGPSTISGVSSFYTVDGVHHNGSIQPYLAFYRTLSGTYGQGLFLQGFVGADAPFCSTDATFLFNDIGLGYIFRRPCPRGLTAVIPMFEVHANTPLNNLTHGVQATDTLAATTGYNTITGTVNYDSQVNLTTGTTFVFNQRSTVSFAGALPAARPHSDNFELQLYFNRYFGAGSPAVPAIFR